MVFAGSGLIPSRFLTLISHFTIIVTILWSKEENIRACLPEEYSEDDYKRKDSELTVGLSLALGLMAVELLGFLFGISMFLPSVALMSVLAHSSASVLLSYFLLDEWDCDLYWAVFTLCSAVPALVEIACLVAFCLRRA